MNMSGVARTLDYESCGWAVVSGIAKLMKSPPSKLGLRLFLLSVDRRSLYATSGLALQVTAEF